ncbi:MAG TPA: CBS domain-containing protein [Thermomicrobiales bacterium]|nr:CBS domain-containing protein [Thermomicrobiales bacterium]
MVMFAELRRFMVADARGRRTRLRDLAIDLAAGDYPSVTQIFVHDGQRRLAALLWDAVESISWRERTIRVADLDAAQPPSPEALAQAVLLRRDILDALVLDIQSQDALRANDLWLMQEDGVLRLRAVDASPWAVLRRISRGLLGREAGRDLHDWRSIEFLRGDPSAAQAGRDYHRRVAHLPPGQIASLMESLPYLHAAELLTLLPDPLAADVLEVMAPERRLQVFEELDDDYAERLLALMAPDNAADLLGQLPLEQARRRVEDLPAPQRQRLIDLLRYPDDTAGGIMTNDVPTIPAGLTVREARERLSGELATPDMPYYVYVVAPEPPHALRGLVTLRDLVIAGDERRLDEIMTSGLLVVRPLESARDAAQRIIDSQLLALPVVADDGRVLGAVTVDAAIAQAAPESWRRQAPRVFS